MPSRTSWPQDIGIGIVVLLVGMMVIVNGGVGYSWGEIASRTLILLAVSAAVAAFRQAPGTALGLTWAVLCMHVASGTPIMLVELFLALVAFGTARYGSRAVVQLSAISIPLAALLILFFGLYTISASFSSPLAGQFEERLTPLGDVGTSIWLPATFLLGMLPLGVPWLVGLLLRGSEATRRSRAEQAVAEQDRAEAEAARDQASEIAHLRAQQVQLANDVHDVVGHSLTVILAQAESAQFLPAGDWERAQQTFQNIVTTARQSLGDVRQVLAGTTNDPARATAASLDTLIEGVRAAGNDVRSTVIGTPQPLPPEMDAVAFRVLQEMLTNALKHGRRGGPVEVERHWHGELRIEVINRVDICDAVMTEDTLGLDGMRRRLESVGGRLDVRRRGDAAEASEATFTVTAWVPLRPVPIA